MPFLKKLQEQPEYVRKIILWLVVIIIGLILVILWIHSAYSKIKNFPKGEIIEKFNIPAFREEFDTLPKIEIPQIPEEELKKLEEGTNELEGTEGKEENPPAGGE